MSVRGRRGKTKGIQLTRHTRFGEVSAETDKVFLESAFYETHDYVALTDVKDPRCFVVGRTGVGKSALLTKLKSQGDDCATQIAPKSLSLEYITGRQVAKLADEFDVNIEPLYVELWKHVIVTAVLRQKFGAYGESHNRRWQALIGSLKGDKSTEVAKQYLIEFKDEFWKKTDEVVKNHTQRIEQRLGSKFAGELDVGPARAGGSAASETLSTEEVESARAQRFKQFVGDNQLARLGEVIKVLDDKILAADGAFFVVVDDLDEDWVDESMYRSLMLALFRTVKELAVHDHLKVVVAVRTNILAQLDFDSPSSGQWEKYDGLLLNIRWTKSDLTRLLDQRASTLVERLGGRPGTVIKDLLPTTTGTNQDDPLDFILDRTLMRPRDAIAFLNAALEHSDGDAKITMKAIRTAEPSYSKSRLKALHDEWKLVYRVLPDLTRLFAGGAGKYRREELGDLLSDFAMESEHGPRAEMFPSFHSSLDVEQAWSGEFMAVVSVLFEVGFLGVNLPHAPSGFIYSQSEPQKLEGVRSIPNDCRFEVHRAFRATLDISDTYQPQ